MRSKISAVLVGWGCVIAAAFRQNATGGVQTAALGAGFLAAFGVACVLCAGFLGGYVSRSGFSRIANSPQIEGDEIFIFVGWLLIILGAILVICLYL